MRGAYLDRTVTEPRETYVPATIPGPRLSAEARGASGTLVIWTAGRRAMAAIVEFQIEDGPAAQFALNSEKRFGEWDDASTWYVFRPGQAVTNDPDMPVLTPGPLTGRTNRSLEFQIPSGQGSETLRLVSDATGLVIVCGTRTMNTQTNSVSGTMTVSEAMSRMLEGTFSSARFQSDEVILITRP
jgi:hypothetical protein